jgi:hypothetical protein
MLACLAQWPAWADEPSSVRDSGSVTESSGEEPSGAPAENALTEASGDYSMVVSSARKSSDTSSVHGVDAVTQPGTFGDPVSAARNFPSVARAPLGVGPIVVRGGRVGDTITLLDGLPFPHLLHFDGFTSILPAPAIQSVDLYAGPGPVSFPLSLSGSLDVRLKQDRVPRRRGILTLSLLDTGAYYEAPVGEESSLSFSVRRSVVDLYAPKLIEAFDIENVLIQVPPSYADFSARYWFRSARQSLSVTLVGSRDRASVGSTAGGSFFASSITLRRDVDFVNGSLRWVRELPDRFSAMVSFNSGYYDSVLAFGPNLKLAQDTLSALTQVELSKRFQRVTLLAGIGGTLARQNVGLRTPIFGAPGEIVDTSLSRNVVDLGQRYQYANLFGHLKADLRLGSRWRLTAAARLERNGLLQRTWIGPRLGLRFRPMSRVLLFANAATSFQQPTIERIVQAGTGLREERTRQLEAGVMLGTPDEEFLNVSFYADQQSQLATRSTENAYDVAASPQLVSAYTSNGQARIYGAELSGGLRGDRFFGMVAFSVIHRERANNSLADLLDVWVGQRFSGLALAGVNLPRRLIVSTRVRLADGNLTLPTSVSVLDSDTGQYVPALIGSSSEVHLPLFFQWDVRIEKTWTFRAWSLVTFLDVQNVTNRGNAEAQVFSYDYTRSLNIRGIPILPVLGFRGEL